MHEEINRVLSESFLFIGMDEQKRAQCLRQLRTSTQSFKRGQIIFSPEKFVRQIGFILRGKCEVLRLCPGGDVLALNLLMPGDSFGVLALFREAQTYPTQIVAKTPCCVVFVEGEDVETLIRNNPDAAYNTIRFLACRVCFLGEKVRALGGANVEEKLRALLSARVRQNGQAPIQLNLSQTAKTLRCARASLYRALDALEKEGWIQRCGTSVRILCPEKFP